MSLESWIKEFYPITAGDCPKKDALEHSILKWRGALPHNLKKHKIRFRDHTHGCSLFEDTSNDEFFFGLGTCALCQSYYDYGDCVHCPLRVLRKVACTIDTRSSPNPYDKFKRSGDPRPMLRLLYAARQRKIKTGLRRAQNMYWKAQAERNKNSYYIRSVSR